MIFLFQRIVLNGDWGLGIGDWAQSPIPNPQSPIPNPQSPLVSFLSFYFPRIINNFFKAYLINFNNINFSP
jgi:hypothetical protein